MLYMISITLLSKENAHYIFCMHRLHLYLLSSTERSRVFHLYPMAFMLTGLQCNRQSLLCKNLPGLRLGVILSDCHFVILFVKPLGPALGLALGPRALVAIVVLWGCLFNICLRFEVLNWLFPKVRTYNLPSSSIWEF